MLSIFKTSEMFSKRKTKPSSAVPLSWMGLSPSPTQLSPAHNQPHSPLPGLSLQHARLFSTGLKELPEFWGRELSVRYQSSEHAADIQSEGMEELTLPGESHRVGTQHPVPHSHQQECSSSFLQPSFSTPTGFSQRILAWCWLSNIC